MVNRDEILRVVQAKGPIIPNELKKEIKAGDTIILGAILSEFKAYGKINITHTKVGSSPAYYTPGTEARLERLIKYLNEKERRTAEFLRQKKILKDSEQSPLVRVSLRNIRDFAKPLEVNVKGQKEIYWKWYMLSTKEAQEMILKQVKPEKIPEEKPISVQKSVPEPILKVTPKQEVKIEPKKPEIIPVPKPEIKPEVKKEVKQEIQQELGILFEELEREKDPFFKKVWGYCKSNDIQIIEYKIIRKKSDIELTLTVPSRIGNQEYYSKAKKKKKINDGDLSSAYVHGQANKLPVIYKTTGDMTKKAKEMLVKDFKGMTIKKI